MSKSYPTDALGHIKGNQCMITRCDNQHPAINLDMYRPRYLPITLISCCTVDWTLSNKVQSALVRQSGPHGGSTSRGKSSDVSSAMATYQ